MRTSDNSVPKEGSTSLTSIAPRGWPPPKHRVGADFPLFCLKRDLRYTVWDWAAVHLSQSVPPNFPHGLHVHRLVGHVVGLLLCRIVGLEIWLTTGQSRERGVLRKMRQDDDDTSRYRRGTPDLRDRSRGCKARRVRNLQHPTDRGDSLMTVRLKSEIEHGKRAKCPAPLRM